MEELLIHQLWPLPYGRSMMSPFEASADFSQDCWQASEALATCPSDRFYSFTQGTEEVVRMLIVDGRGPVDHSYRVPVPLEDAVEIYFIETAVGHRRNRMATTAIELVRTHYSGRVFVAFPDGQRGFWDSLGWFRCDSTSSGRLALYLSGCIVATSESSMRGDPQSRDEDLKAVYPRTSEPRQTRKTAPSHGRVISREEAFGKLEIEEPKCHS